jgi:hypothetical protein
MLVDSIRYYENQLKRTGREVDHSPHLAQRLNDGSIPLVLLTSSWRVEGLHGLLLVRGYSVDLGTQ